MLDNMKRLGSIIGASMVEKGRNAARAVGSEIKSEPLKDVLTFRAQKDMSKIKDALKNNINADLAPGSRFVNIYSEVAPLNAAVKGNEAVADSMFAEIRAKKKAIDDALRSVTSSPSDKNTISYVLDDVATMEKDLKTLESRFSNFSKGLDSSNSVLEGKQKQMQRMKDNSLAKSLFAYSVPVAAVSDLSNKLNEKKDEENNMEYASMVDKIANELAQQGMDKVASVSQSNIELAGGRMVDGILWKMAAAEKYNEAATVVSGAIEALSALGYEV